MVGKNIDICPYCGGPLQPRGYIWRRIKKENGKKSRVKILRKSCKNCGKWHRVIPDNIIPYKQYTKDIIEGFAASKLNNDMLEFEDYPCDITVKRWVRKNFK